MPYTKPDCSVCNTFNKIDSKENSVFVVDMDDIVVKVGRDNTTVIGKWGICEECFRKCFEIIETLPG